MSENGQQVTINLQPSASPEVTDIELAAIKYLKEVLKRMEQRQIYLTAFGVRGTEHGQTCEVEFVDNKKSRRSVRQMHYMLPPSHEGKKL